MTENLPTTVEQAQPQDLEDELAEEAEYEEEGEVVLPKHRISQFQPGVVIKATDMVLNPDLFKWKVFLAGPSGSGKSLGLTTLPGKKLLIDFDNRAESVIGLPDVDIYPCHEPKPKSPKAWRKADALRQVIISEVNKGIFPYDSILFDGLTMLGRFALNWALTLDSGRGLGGAPAQQHYLPQMDALAKFVLSTVTLPLHIGYTGHIEPTEEKQTGQLKYYPKITGKLRSEVANWFNETFFCYRTPDDNGILKYYWLTAGSGTKEFFKSSLNQLGKYWKDPIKVDFDKPPVGFADLFNRRFVIGEMKEEAEDKPLKPQKTKQEVKKK